MKSKCCVGVKKKFTIFSQKVFFRKKIFFTFALNFNQIKCIKNV